MDIGNLVTSRKAKTVTTSYNNTAWELELAYLPKEMLQAITRRNTKPIFNKSTHLREDTLDRDGFLRELLSESLKGWKGLTLELLAEYVPLDEDKVKALTEEDFKSEIPYSPNDALVVGKKSYDFENFIITFCTNVGNFQ